MALGRPANEVLAVKTGLKFVNESVKKTEEILITFWSYLILASGLGLSLAYTGFFRCMAAKYASIGSVGSSTLLGAENGFGLYFTAFSSKLDFGSSSV